MQNFGLEGDPEWAARYMLLWKATPKEVMERQNNIQRAFKAIHKEITKQLDIMIGNQPQQPSIVSSWYGRFKIAFNQVQIEKDVELITRRLNQVISNLGISSDRSVSTVQWAISKVRHGFDLDKVFQIAFDDLNVVQQEVA